MIHKCKSMDPDLIARTCGFVGVLGSLIAVGIMDNPKFIITPQQNFESVLLTLNVAQNAPEDPLLEEPIKEEEEATPPKPEPKVEPEPQPKVEPKPEPKAEPKVEPLPPPPEVVKPEPLKQEIKPEPKPQPKPKPVAKPEPERHQTAVKPDSSQKPKTSPAPSAAPAKPKATEQQDRMIAAELSSLIVKEIKSKLRYPRNAVRRKLEGTVMVEFVIERGVVISFSITKSSGHKILDEAAGKLAKSLIRFNTKLSSMNNRVMIPIKYELV